MCLLVAVQTAGAVPVRHKRDRTPCKQMEVNSRLAIRLRLHVTDLRDSIPVDPEEQDLPTLVPSLSQSFSNRNNLTHQGRLQWIEDRLLMFREMMMASRAEGDWTPELRRKLQRVIDDTRGLVRAVRVALNFITYELFLPPGHPTGHQPGAQ
ncbi:hypothetical protein Bbelb_298720 [Branchiostoma belcheri]|nr:hypothetical protein Bbelb_298720 [Branchiostoma belcheri]